MTHRADAIGVRPQLRKRLRQHVVEQELQIGHTAPDPAFATLGRLLGSLVLLAQQLGCDDFGMIHRRDHITVTRQVGGEEGGCATAATAVVREQD